MKNYQIHQFSPSASRGDGVTNGIFYTQKILHSLGFISNIYVEHRDENLKKEVQHYSKINKKDAQQLLLVHYCIYYDFSTWLDKLDIKKVLIYHNITPHTFFDKSDILYTLCKQGKEYLPELERRVIASIGVSKLNTEELQEQNFTNLYTIPLLLDVPKITSASFDENYFDEKAEEFNIIFVGRIARNKAQHDLIHIADEYAKITSDFKLYIIGGITDTEYEKELHALVKNKNLHKNVIFAGKISNEELYAHYRAADLFLCMSEHEGFGMPIIESMLFATPVIAYNSSNIKNTMNGGGILFEEKSYESIAASIHLLRVNRAFKREILQTQKEAIKIYQHEKVLTQVVAFLQDLAIEVSLPSIEIQKDIKFQFEGPFDSSYSLALLNRQTAQAFETLYPAQVALFSTEGEGDFTPNKNFLLTNPDIKAMQVRGAKAQQCEVTLRNLYPPRVSGMKGELNLLNAYGWEESAFSQEHVAHFNSKLDGISVMSHYVKKVLFEAGVRVPLKVVGLGVEHILSVRPQAISLQTQKSFKFLHISSCFMRKGVDVLLEAYGQAFTQEDDVVLIIKTFPNPHNTIEVQIQAFYKTYKNAPEILLINEDLKEENIAWLYQNTDALVAPSRGEGFGLPMAEAMLFDLAVITTGFGGQRDFCTPKTAWLIDYSFAKAKTHMNLFNSYSAEPSKESLKTLMLEQVQLTQEQRRKKTQEAKTKILQEFTWQNYANKTLSFIQELKDEVIFKEKNIHLAWISTYNTRCGIAQYSEFLLEHLTQEEISLKKYANYTDEVIREEKEQGVTRCWGDTNDKDLKKLTQEVLQAKTTHAIINFNFGFFSVKNLAEMLQVFQTHVIKTSIIFHSVKDVNRSDFKTSLGDIQEVLQKVQHILVHNIEDLNILKTFHIIDNVTLFAHGIEKKQSLKKKETKTFTIASYGFLLPHKGVKEIIEAFALLYKTDKNIRLLLLNSLHTDPLSKMYFTECQELIHKHHIEEVLSINNNFLSEEVAFTQLSRADIIVMPYKQTQESSSAAVRDAIATMRPVLCTPISIFNNVADIVHFTQDATPKALAKSLESLMKDEKLLHSKHDIQKGWSEEHQWSKTAKRLRHICLAT